MDSTRAGRFAILIAMVAWAGVLLQCCLSLKLALDRDQTLIAGLISFLGFFTILTNILVALALTIPLIARRSAIGRYFASPFAVAGVAASIAFVGLAYHFLLRNIWNPRGVHLLADVLLHYVTPLLFVTYWFMSSRTRSLRWVYPLIWSLYPTVYFAYALVRGEIIGTYPYRFIDVSAIGYRQTTINAIGLLFAFILLGLVFVGVDRTRRRAVL